jgi:CHAD domain-containing protein
MRHSRPVPEYLPPADFDIDELARRLPPPLRLGRPTLESGERVFYDTFDRRLRAKELQLHYEDGALRLARGSGNEVAAVPWKWPTDSMEPRQLPAGLLRDTVAPICDIRALLKTTELRSERRRTPVLDDEGKTVARVLSEDAVVVGAAAGDDRLRPRLYLVGVRGYDKAVERVKRVLDEELGLQVASEPLEEEAILRAGSVTGLPSGAEAELTPDLPADRAAVALSLGLLHSIEANLPGTLADIDSEFLHDFRVAVRRTRALQRELKKVFPPDELQRFRDEFRWLQQVTGPSRDLDVYLLDFDDFAAAVPEAQRQDLELLRVLLAERRASERVEMEQALRSPRTTRVIADWADFLERLPTLPVDLRPYAVTSIGEVAALRIARVYRQMVRMGDQIEDTSPHQDLHDLRKKGKELRYLLEFFAALFPTEVTKPMVKTLKALQDTLGRFQDREVQVATLRTLGADVAERVGGANALMAMGVLVERLSDEQDAARAEFHERFAAFSSPEQRALVKETFR